MKHLLSMLPRHKHGYNQLGAIDQATASRFLRFIDHLLLLLHLLIPATPLETYNADSPSIPCKMARCPTGPTSESGQHASQLKHCQSNPTQSTSPSASPCIHKVLTSDAATYHVPRQSILHPQTRSKPIPTNFTTTQAFTSVHLLLDCSHVARLPSASDANLEEGRGREKGRTDQRAGGSCESLSRGSGDQDGNGA